MIPEATRSDAKTGSIGLSNLFGTVHQQVESSANSSGEDSRLAQPAAGSRIKTLWPELLEPVCRWATWAALLEFLLLRVLIRFGPMLPPSPAVAQAAQVVLFAGTVALNVGAILTTLAVLVIAGLTRSRVLCGLLIATVVSTLIRTASPQGITPILDVIFLLYSVLALAAMVAGATLAVARPMRAGQPQGLPLRLLHPLMLILLVVIYIALAYSTVMATVARLGWRWAASESSVAPHFIAEGLAVLVALMICFVYRPERNKRAIAGALIITGLLCAFWIVRPWLASALTQWTVDVATFLPPWLYLLGLAGFLYTVFGLALSGEIQLRFAAWGLTLVALGGLRWDYTYFSGLGLVGFFLLAQPWRQTTDVAY